MSEVAGGSLKEPSTSSSFTEGLKILEIDVRSGNQDCDFSMTPSEVMISTKTDVMASFLTSSVVTVAAYKPIEPIQTDKVSDEIQPYHKSQKKSQAIDYQTLKAMVMRNEKKVAREKQREDSNVPASRSSIQYEQVKDVTEERPSLTEIEEDSGSIKGTILVITYLEDAALQEITFEALDVDVEKLKQSMQDWTSFTNAEEYGEDRIVMNLRCRKDWELKHFSPLYESEILTQLMAAQVESMITSVTFAKKIQLAFSTNSSGFHIEGIYEAMNSKVQSNLLTLVIVKDAVNEIVGVVYNGPIHPEVSVASSSENWIWEFKEGNVEKGCCESTETPFVACGESSLAFGFSGIGKTAIEFPESLRNGQIETPGSDEFKDFEVKHLEVYIVDN